MRKYMTLTKVLLKSSMGMLSDGKSKNKALIALYGLLLLCMIPIPIGIYALISSMLEAYASMDQLGSVLGNVMFLASILIFMLSLFLIPSIFYFSSDNAILLALPLKPEQILASKFSVCVIYEYIFCLFILVPSYTAYAQYTSVSIFFYLVAAVSILFLPVYPLVLSTLITILVMRFVPFFKNRDRFNMIGGIIIFIIAMSFSFYTQSISASDSEAMMRLLLEGNDSMLSIYSIIFPSLPFFARAMVQGDILQFLIAISIPVIALCILMTLGKFLYFKGAIGFGETASSHKTISKQELEKTSQTKNKLLSYVIKEMKLLIRTPVYFLNCISICIIMPAVFVLLPMLTGNSSSMDFQTLFAMLDPSINLVPHMMLIGIGTGFFLGTMNSISATAISREGSSLMYMKYIPMAYKDQIHAKSLCGICLGILTILLTIISLMLVLPLPLHYYGIIFVCGSITTIFGNELGIIFDVLHPKLVWEQEAAAVKQNMGAMLVMFSGMALCFLCIGICFFIPTAYLTWVSYAILLLALLGAIGGWILAGRVAEAGMRKL